MRERHRQALDVLRAFHDEGQAQREARPDNPEPAIGGEWFDALLAVAEADTEDARATALDRLAWIVL